jgi:hypothetical protein
MKAVKIALAASLLAAMPSAALADKGGVPHLGWNQSAEYKWCPWGDRHYLPCFAAAHRFF